MTIQRIPPYDIPLVWDRDLKIGLANRKPTTNERTDRASRTKATRENAEAKARTCLQPPGRVRAVPETALSRPRATAAESLSISCVGKHRSVTVPSVDLPSHSSSLVCTANFASSSSGWETVVCGGGKCW